jgi:predicted RNA-binding protein with RPS1 domain
MHEYAIGFEKVVQYVKPFRSFIDIRKDIGMFHIHEVSHAHVTNMDGMFITRGKMKVHLN